MASRESSEAGKAPPRVGSYRLIQPLGSGGMSSVFHAIHLETGHEVAVKVLPRTLARNPTLLQRFLREAKSAESLEHPNIAAIYDRGFDQGRHYLVLEYVAGGDLHERVRAGGPLPIAEAVRVIRSAAEGLDYASGRGVIHRDVKPANLLVTPEGRVKIIDLGLALQTESEDERVTRDGTTVGTVDYMAPEQARDSRATSERSDIYSLGCTFYFLLTGSPPYPGGDVPDKLGRHCTAAIPDVRDLRPEVPEPLALLIRRMMAKKAEARFPDYLQLIAALDALPLSETASHGALDALIADDEEDGGGVQDALIADEEDDEITLVPTGESPQKPVRPRPTIGGPATPPSGRKARRQEQAADSGPAEISLAMLAGIEDDAPPTLRRQRTGAPGHSPDPVFLAGDAARAVPRASSKDVPLSTWIAAGAVLGLAIALLGFGVLQLLNPGHPEVTRQESGADEGQGAAGDNAPAAVVSPPITRPVARPLIPPKAAQVVAAPTTPVWTEPDDPTNPPAPEPTYPAEIEARSLPEWARKPIPTAVEGPLVTVRRIPSTSDSSDVASLRAALDRSASVVEIADNGPFFEDDLRITGKTRVIRARPGFRPMIVVESSATALVRDRPSVVSLDGARLTLEGLDLVVDSRSLPPSLTCLFLLRASELTLSHCTVTILNATQHPFGLVRVEEPGDQRPNRASHFRLDGSLVRGPSPTVFDIPSQADLAIIRSVVIGAGDTIVLHRLSPTRGDRRYFVYRSLLANRGAVLELSGGGTSRAQVRALGSTFAKVVGLDDASLVHARTEVASPPTALLDWVGHDDAFVGWSSWLDSGERRKVVLSNLGSVRETWKGTEEGGRESRRGWSIDDLARPSTMGALPESRPAVLARVAEPPPMLIEQTVGSFRAPPVPPLARRTTADATSAPAFSPRTLPSEPLRPGVNASISPGTARAGVPSSPTRTIPSQATAPPSSGGELTFDVTDATYRGDLGVFLARRVSAGVAHVVVKVVGGGTWTMTPVRLPDGVSVEIESAPSGGGGPTWVPSPGSVAPALLELQGGDLTLTGISLAWSPSSRIGRLVRVEDGHLILSRCTLRSGESAMPAGSGLLLFRAPSTRPIPSRAGTFLTLTDRPTCLLVDCLLMTSGGEALAAELGRGLVSLVDTAILSEGEGTSIALRPQKVARARFDADLSLDHCSIASERSLVELGPWPGAVPGPARPWLVSSTKSAFFEVAPRGKRGAVLLRALGDGLTHGSLAWQANGDGYDLAYFTTDGPDDPWPARQRPDVKSLWVDFWGARHIQNVIGPNPRKGDGASVLTRDRLRPDGLTVEDLRLDPKAHPDLGVDLRLLPGGVTRRVPIPF